MNTVGQQPESGGSPPPKIQPDVSFWDLREVKESSISKTIKDLLTGLTPMGILGALCYIVREILKAEGIEQGLKIVGVIAVVQLLLGLALYQKGANSHAEISTDEANKSAHA